MREDQTAKEHRIGQRTSEYSFFGHLQCHRRSLRHGQGRLNGPIEDLVVFKDVAYQPSR